MASSDGNNNNQRCCMGVLYMQHAMGKQAKQPVCVGVGQGQKNSVHIEDRTSLTAGTPSFKFVCVGHSVYAHESGSGKPADAPAQLPYCEGIEIIVAEQAEQRATTAPQQQTAQQVHQQQAGPSGVSGADRAPAYQQHAHHSRRQQQQRQQQAQQEEQQGSSSLFGQQQGSNNESNAFGDRFARRAQANLDQMRSHLQVAYTTLVKPLVDKYAKDD